MLCLGCIPKKKKKREQIWIVFVASLHGILTKIVISKRFPSKIKFITLACGFLEEDVCFGSLQLLKENFIAGNCLFDKMDESGKYFKKKCTEKMFTCFFNCNIIVIPTLDSESLFTMMAE